MGEIPSILARTGLRVMMETNIDLRFGFRQFKETLPTPRLKDSHQWTPTRGLWQKEDESPPTQLSWRKKTMSLFRQLKQ